MKYDINNNNKIYILEFIKVLQGSHLDESNSN